MEVLNLQKGERVDLTKTHPGLKVVHVGLGWDVKSGSGDAFDLDAYCLLLGGTPPKLVDNKAVIFFGNKVTTGIEHMGDNLTGAGDGDDETIKVDLSKITCDEVRLGANIYQAVTRRQNFGQVNNAFIRVYDPSNNEVLAKFDLSENFSSATGIELGRIYKVDGEWKFQAVGEPKNGDLNEIAAPYR